MSVDEGHYRSDDQDVEGGGQESQDQDGSDLTKEVGMVETVGSVEDDGGNQELQVGFVNDDVVQDIIFDELQHQSDKGSTDDQQSRLGQNLWREGEVRLLSILRDIRQVLPR